MTQEALESYITRLLPTLRRKYVKIDDNEECCQQALIDLVKKADQLSVTNDKDFIKVFLSFYNTVKFGKRTAQARAFKAGHTTHSLAPGRYVPDYGPVDDTVSFAHFHWTTSDEPVCDPWTSPRIQAEEFIELLPTEIMKKIFRLYYIEGFTLVEMESLVGLKKSRINVILTQGIHYLQQQNKTINTG